MIELSDLDIERAAKELTANPNCNIVLMENMSWKDSRTCTGRLKVVDGKVKMVDTCGEPCSFVCDTSREFDKNVSRVKNVIRVINLVKKD